MPTVSAQVALKDLDRKTVQCYLWAHPPETAGAEALQLVRHGVRVALVREFGAVADHDRRLEPEEEAVNAIKRFPEGLVWAYDSIWLGGDSRWARVTADGEVQRLIGDC